MPEIFYIFLVSIKMYDLIKLMTSMKFLIRKMSQNFFLTVLRQTTTFILVSCLSLTTVLYKKGLIVVCPLCLKPELTMYRLQIFY